VRWASTPLRIAADVLSLMGLVACVLLVARTRADSREARRSSLASRGGAALEEFPAGFGPAGAVACAILLFGLTKVAILDRVDNPLVRQLADGCPRGTTCLAWGGYADEIRLGSYQLDGDSSIVLFWRAEAAPARDYAVELTLFDMTGVPVKTLARAHPGNLPTSRWSPGDVVWDQYQWEPPATTLPLAYRVAVSVLDPLSGERLPVVDAPAPGVDSVPVATVRYPRPAPAPGPEEVTTDLLFDGSLRLLAIRFPDRVERGATLSYALRWETVKEVQTDYTVFVHLLDQNGVLVAGDDAQPLQGLYPTSIWTPGEVVLDERAWKLDVPAGEYTVEVGLYNLATGERMRVVGPGALGDSALVGRIRVSE